LTTKSKPRLLVLNQYYAPAYESTAHLLAQLCEDLTSDFEVTVVTGMVRRSDVHPGAYVRNGVKVVRVKSTSFDRRRLWLRALNYLSYLFASVTAALRQPRPHIVLCMTDPPIIANVALIVARRFRAPLVVITQDVFPEIAVELNRITNPLVIGLLRKAVREYLRRADHIVAIGDRMKARLIEKGADSRRVTVIPNWTDTQFLEPQPHDNEWSRTHGLATDFVVMHSGNVGHAQNLDAFVRAGSFLRDLDRLSLVVVGSGARLADLVGLGETLEVDSLRFLPYQPLDVLPESLSAGDVHVVGLARGLAGYVVPSRLYGILSVGRPVIVAAEEGTETVDVVRAADCGIVVPPGRPELLAEAIRDAYDGKYDLEGMGARGREFVTAEADRLVAVERYRWVLRDALSRR
jgi:colanic acid biosynthesis glycosyl transferase WcaI